MLEQNKSDGAKALQLGWLESAGKALTVLVGVLLALSVFYDFAYLHALGLGFGRVPTTLSDHTRTAILWVPILGIIGLLWVGLLMLLRTATSSRNSAKDSRAKEARSTKWWPWFGLLIVVLLVFMLLWSNDHSGFYLVGFIVWALFAGILDAKGNRAGMPQISFALVMGIPAAFLLVGAFGSVHGMLEFREEKPAWLVKLSRNGGSEDIKALGIRRFEEALIYVDETKRVHVVPPSRVLEVRRVDTPFDPRPYICRIPGWTIRWSACALPMQSRCPSS